MNILYNSGNRQNKLNQKHIANANLQHLNYLDTLDYKKNRVLNILNRFDLPNPVIIQNENNLYYRNKIELKIVNKKIGFYEKNTNKLIEINECKITKKSINKVISLIKSFNLNYANIIIRSNYNDEVLIIINSKENISINDDLSKYKILGIILNDKTIYGENHFNYDLDIDTYPRSVPDDIDTSFRYPTTIVCHSWSSGIV